MFLPSFLFSLLAGESHREAVESLDLIDHTRKLQSVYEIKQCCRKCCRKWGSHCLFGVTWWLPQHPLWDHGHFIAQVLLCCSNCAVLCCGYHTIRLLSSNALNLVKQSRTLWGPSWCKSFLCPPFLVCETTLLFGWDTNPAKTQTGTWTHRLGLEPTVF